MADPDAAPRGPRRRPVVIDFHAHTANDEVNAATYVLSVLGRLRATGEGTAIHAMPEAHWERMTNLSTRLADMDEMGAFTLVTFMFCFSAGLSGSGRLWPVYLYILFR